MNAVLKATDWYQQLLHTAAGEMSSFEQVPAIQQLRKEARETFNRIGFPNKKQEAWRYSNIQSLLAQTFTPTQSLVSNNDRDLLDEISTPIVDSYRLVFMDNRFRPDLSSIESLPNGVNVQGLSNALQSSPDQIQYWLGSVADHVHDSFIALNTALMSDGLFIRVEADTCVNKPIEVCHLITSRDEPVTAIPRVLVVLAAGANATLIERFSGTGHTFYFQNMVEEIILDENATLRHYRLVTEQDQAYHLSNIDVRQAKNSAYSALSMDLSGAWLRTNYCVDFQGQDARCDLRGIYLVNDKQHTNVHTNILHHVPSCTSEQAFKGLLLGSGRAVFDGRILVDKQAQFTDAQLTNNNLMLSDEAEVDTKPQLEIYADNVKCSHGTTVGQLEPEQLFYLRSRGIAEVDALRMLCRGFASEILESCELDAVREFAEQRIQQTLSIDVS